MYFPFQTPPEAYEVIEIQEGVKWLRLKLPFALNHINLYLVREPDGTWAIIDSGLAMPASREQLSHIFAHHLDGQKISRVIITHYHPDHLGNAQWIAEQFGVQIEMSLTEFLVAHSILSFTPAFKAERLREHFLAHGLAAEMADMAGRRDDTFDKAVPTMPKSITRLHKDTPLHLGGEDWQIFEGHGHTPEHLSFYSKHRQLLIAGDMMLPSISTNVSVWPYEPEADSVQLFLDSIDEYLSLPEDTLVLPSHGLPFVGMHERIQMLHDHHELRLNEMYVAMTGEHTAAEMMPVLFKRKLDVHQTFFAIVEAIAHMNHGWKTGRLHRVKSPEGIYLFSKVKSQST